MLHPGNRTLECIYTKKSKCHQTNSSKGIRDVGFVSRIHNGKIWRPRALSFIAGLNCSRPLPSFRSTFGNDLTASKLWHGHDHKHILLLLQIQRAEAVDACCDSEDPRLHMQYNQRMSLEPNWL